MVHYVRPGNQLYFEAELSKPAKSPLYQAGHVADKRDKQYRLYVKDYVHLCT
jgi:hypothetical protein